MLPSIVVFLISIINLTYGNYFYFSLWLMATILTALIFFPIAFNANDRDVPVFQVFASLLIIPIFFSIYAIMDLNQIGIFTQGEVLLYGVLAGVGIIVLIMTLKGKK
jgi:hypothetical protein